jgi:exopolyphosphatase/guanosine-5'-triphosphate,3'-diphosphate pyrophosphatase
VDQGLLFDLGGGSLQVSQFRRRRAGRNWSLPLGALRLSHRFLESDPPSVGELRRLKEHVHQELEREGLPRLADGDRLVGTGGTLRNLAKVDRRARSYPIERVHGYTLSRKRVREMVSGLSERRQARRASTPGLSDARADSIVGGAIAIETLMETVGATRVVVSGEGVREGLAYSLLAPGLPSIPEVRAASVASLASRFTDWRAELASARREMVATLHRTLDRAAPPDVQEALLHAATLLDLGRSIDFFDRHEHAADIVVATDLNGFSHRGVALLAGVLLAAGDEAGGVKALSPLVKELDRPFVMRAGVVLALADDILERSRRDRHPRLSCRVREREVVISAPDLRAWRPRGIGERFQHAFGRRLDVRPGGR